MLIRLSENKPKFLALSTDEKPTSQPIGSALFEIDTKIEYIFDGQTWVVRNTYPLSKTLKWLNISILPNGEHFGSFIDCKDFNSISAFVSADGNVDLSIRLSDEDGTDYTWDYLGVMNPASPKASAQANITGIPKIYVAVVNNTVSTVNANLYVYLGRK